MATMVKEKRREKKRSKERSSATKELPPVTIEPPLLEEFVHITETTSGNETSKTDTIESNTQADEVIEEAETSNISIEIIEHTEETNSKQTVETNTGKQEDIAQPSCIVDQIEHINETPQIAEIDNKSIFSEVSPSSIDGSYKELSKQLKKIAIPNEVTEVTEEYELVQETHETSFECVEDIMPSAPCFEEVPQTVQYEELAVASLN